MTSALEKSVKYARLKGVSESAASRDCFAPAKGSGKSWFGTTRYKTKHKEKNKKQVLNICLDITGKVLPALSGNGDPLIFFHQSL